MHICEKKTLTRMHVCAKKALPRMHICALKALTRIHIQVCKEGSDENAYFVLALLRLHCSHMLNYKYLVAQW